MRYSSKKGLWAVITLLGSAALLASACGGSGGDDRNGSTAGSGNSTANGGATQTAGAAGTINNTSGNGTGGAATCDSAAQCCPTTKCPCPYPAGDGTNTAIADMEDGTTKFKPAGVAAALGYWDLSKDASTGTVMPANTMALMTVDGGANGTTKSLKVVGSMLTGWGAALAAEVSNGCPFDGVKYGGISFYAKGTSSVLEGANKLLVLVGMPEFIPNTAGGFCNEAAVPADQNCYARHRVTITLTPEWKKYTVAWPDLKAPGYLTLGPAFSANRIRDIVFNASGPEKPTDPATSFDFSIDELKFVPTGTPSENLDGPATGGAGAGAGGAAAGGASGSGGSGGASAGAGGAAAGSGGTAG